jgi:hypothetical protein
MNHAREQIDVQAPPLANEADDDRLGSKVVFENMGQSAQTAHPDNLIGRIRPAALARMRRVVRLSGSSASC